VSTDLLDTADLLDRPWRLHSQVSVRPEQFGALLYHFGTRRLSFLKDPMLLTVVRSLDAHDSARRACLAAGVPVSELRRYRTALSTLAAARIIEERRPT